MPNNVFRRSVIRFALFTVVAFGLITKAPVLAQPPTPKSETSTDPEALKKLLERIQHQQTAVHRWKNLAPPTEAKLDQVSVLLDVAHIGNYYANNGQSRYFAFHLLLANPTGHEYRITKNQITAEIDGQDRTIKELPKYLKNYSIPSVRQTVPISTISFPNEWILPANGQTGIWIVFAEAPFGNTTPHCRLKISTDQLKIDMDINEIQIAQIDLHSERIGPRKCLGLLTINGWLNSFNAGILVEELDKLVDQKVNRVALCWGEDATHPETQLMHWLQMAATVNGGNPNQNSIFPVIPTSIREFHLTEFPTNRTGQGLGNSGISLRPTPQPRIHKTASESVGAALRTAYLSLPREELLNEIQNGHPLTRPAALAIGGGRLDADQLPKIFEWAEDQDPELQKAAIQSLSQFGEPQAIEKLVALVKRNVDPVSIVALESLAGSRFGAAHEALLNLLKNEPVTSKRNIVRVLAKYPRPIWSDALFHFVTDPSEKMDPESLKALVQVGHPKLVDVLEKALNSPDKPLQDQAFKELSKRGDEHSERLAVEHALKLLENGPPDGTIVTLITRTKDSRAVPLLLKQLTASGERGSTINLLLQLADRNVIDHLVDSYVRLNTNEKVQVLQGLKPFHHPRFRSLCGEALLSNESALVTVAANALKDEGHTEGEKLLIAALSKQKAPHLWGNIVNALAHYGTPTARAALIEARDSGDSKRKGDLNKILELLSSRSPGYHYYIEGLQLREKKGNERDAMESFNLAIQIDPVLPEAYIGRGMLYLKAEKYSAARKDFEKVLELRYDPKDIEFGEFVTCLSISRIVDGDLADGLKYLEQNREESIRKSQEQGLKGLFHYNAACAYSRAIEQVDRKPENPDKSSDREKYRRQAIVDLTESFDRGFRDYDYTAKDPDFKILRSDPEFKAILARKSTDQSDDKPSPDDE